MKTRLNLAELETRLTPAWNLAINTAGQILVGNAAGQILAGIVLLTPTDGQSLLSIDDVTVLEGHSGTTSAVFAVTRSGVLDQAVTVNFATADGSAKAGSDYLAASGTLTFAPGEATKLITIPINGDRFFEAIEVFEVILSGATNAIIIDGRGNGAIVDDEPRLTITDAYYYEGNSGPTAFTFTIRLSAATDATVTVIYTTADGSAAAGSDYQAATGTLTFAPGETSKPVVVPVSGDRLGEPDKSFFVNLSGATNAIIADGQAGGTIVDDEPRINISDVTKAEGRRNKTTLFTFTVTLSIAYDQPVTVSFRTANGTATTGDNDYVARSGTLTFLPGETSKTITIEVQGDSKREADETFYLDLFGISDNMLFTKSRGVGTILNDD